MCPDVEHNRLNVEREGSLLDGGLAVVSYLVRDIPAHLVCQEPSIPG